MTAAIASCLGPFSPLYLKCVASKALESVGVKPVDTWNPAPCRVAWRAKSAARSTRESKWAARPAARPPPLRRRKPSRDDSNHHPLAPRPTPSAARRLSVRQRRHGTHDNYNKFNMNDTHLRQ